MKHTFACSGLAASVRSLPASSSSWSSHILLSAGIPVCPIPPLHPDQSRQILFFEHLQKLLDGPTIIAEDSTISQVASITPDMKTLSYTQLHSTAADESSKFSVFPARLASPDDIVALMLTSGSTGNCKAVSLRHSNLLSSIRGKIKHHQTTSSSRFLNWIAFDHVACMSEIHLQALEADARYAIVEALANEDTNNSTPANIMLRLLQSSETPAILLTGVVNFVYPIHSVRTSFSLKFAVIPLRSHMKMAALICPGCKPSFRAAKRFPSKLQLNFLTSSSDMVPAETSYGLVLE